MVQNPTQSITILEIKHRLNNGRDPFHPDIHFAHRIFRLFF